MKFNITIIKEYLWIILSAGFLAVAIDTIWSFSGQDWKSPVELTVLFCGFLAMLWCGAGTAGKSTTVISISWNSTTIEDDEKEKTPTP